MYVLDGVLMSSGRLPRFLVAASVLVAASLLAPAGAGAQTGTIVSGQVPRTGGYGLFVFGGGSSEELVSASGCPRETAVFWATSEGEFVGFIPGSAVSAVNAQWETLFADGIPAYTGIVGRCVSTPPPPGYAVFPYRVVLSGPSEARPGDEVTYQLEYQRVSEGPSGEVVLVYGGTGSASSGSLVSIRAVSGPEFTDFGAQIAGQSERIWFAGDGGVLEVTVRIDADFVGETGLSFYVPGTGILMPTGTVNSLRTEVGP
jgi:hypothetical protein